MANAAQRFTLGDIVDLPKRKTAKQLARSYMMGELAPMDYEDGGGVFRLMRIADESRSDIASVQALDKLSRLADLERDTAENVVIPIRLIDIKNDGQDNAVRITTA